LKGDGHWTTTKEILGWTIDGVSRSISLPMEKYDRLTSELSNFSKRRFIQVKALQKLQGRLIHASFGIPNGKGLLSPLIALMTKHADHPHRLIKVTKNLRQVFIDWISLLNQVKSRPTLCRDLVPAAPDYIGYCDASHHGAGGVWFGGQRTLPPVVWRVAFPTDIGQSIISSSNPTGHLTNSDLEMAGMLCQWLVLESIAPVAHAHVAIGCDNTPAVSWTSRLLSSKAPVAAHLLRALAIRMITCEASPLAACHIPGKINIMADMASHSFAAFPEDSAFLMHFSSTFPPPQGASWIMCTLHKKTLGKIFLTLQTTMSTREWWMRTTTKGTVIGDIGVNSCGPISTRSFKTWLIQNKLPSSKLSLSGSDKAKSDEAIRSELAQFRRRFQPSARPSNWLATSTLYSNQTQASSTSAFGGNWKPSDV